MFHEYFIHSILCFSLFYLLFKFHRTFINEFIVFIVSRVLFSSNFFLSLLIQRSMISSSNWRIIPEAEAQAKEAIERERMRMNRGKNFFIWCAAVPLHIPNDSRRDFSSRSISLNVFSSLLFFSLSLLFIIEGFLSMFLLDISYLELSWLHWFLLSIIFGQFCYFLMEKEEKDEEERKNNLLKAHWREAKFISKANEKKKRRTEREKKGKRKGKKHWHLRLSVSR